VLQSTNSTTTWPAVFGALDLHPSNSHKESQALPSNYDASTRDRGALKARGCSRTVVQGAAVLDSHTTVHYRANVGQTTSHNTEGCQHAACWLRAGNTVLHAAHNRNSDTSQHTMYHMHTPLPLGSDCMLLMFLSAQQCTPRTVRKYPIFVVQQMPRPQQMPPGSTNIIIAPCCFCCLLLLC
jgi:hypothetical protein